MMKSSSWVKSKGRDSEDGPEAQAVDDGGMRKALKMRDVSQEARSLPDAGVGKGPCWRLPESKARKDDGVDYETRNRCEILLEQALSCSKHADVRFVFDDGKSLLSGHWGMLCGVCKVFEAMHSCGMEESRTQEARIVGISRESFRGFLEWLYLGRAGKEMAGADGREVWLLAERYQIDSVKEWLMGEGLDSYGLCGAAQYALEGDGERREELLKVCRAQGGSMCLSALHDGCLRGVSACALREVLEGHRCGGCGVLEGERGMERFRVVERWARANGVYGCDGGCDDDVCGLFDAVDLSRVPSEFISKVVRPCGLVRSQRFWDLILKGVGDVCVGDVRLHHIKSFGSRGEGAGQFNQIGHVAVTVGSEGERLAVADGKRHQVVVFDVESGACVMHMGSKGEGPGQFDAPSGVAFNKRGELIVVDRKLDCVQVFDSQGVHMRKFGSVGKRDGQFHGPLGVAVNGQGDIIVCDGGNSRVQIFQEDGMFISKFGSKGTDAGQFDNPAGVAVGPDGSIVVADFGNARVQVFSPLGSHVMTIGSRGEGRGQFLRPFGVCFGLRGEIVVSDWGREDVQVFSRSGELMQCIGRGGDSNCDIHVFNGIALDGHGRAFVGNEANGELCVAMLGMRVL